MSGEVDFSTLVERTLVASIAASSQPATPIVFPNARFDPPSHTAYVGYAIIAAASSNISIGSTKTERTRFALKLSLFCQIQTNDRAYVGLIDQIASAYVGKSFSIALGHTAYFRRATIVSGPEEKDGKYHVIATIPGYRDLDITS